MLSDPVILLQEIEPKKPTHPIKNVGNIKKFQGRLLWGTNELTLKIRVNTAATCCCGET